MFEPLGYLLLSNKNQEPYLHIDETEWSYIKETFEKDDVKESIVMYMLKESSIAMHD